MWIEELKTTGLVWPHLSLQIHPSSRLGKPTHLEYIKGFLAFCFLVSVGNGKHGKKMGGQPEEVAASARQPLQTLSSAGLPSFGFFRPEWVIISGLT